MPHAEMPNARHIREKQRNPTEADERELLGVWQTAQLLRILKEKDPTLEEKVRGGRECIVVPVKGSDTKVAAYLYQSEMSGIEARRTFYIHRIFSTLFPHNFPTFHAAIGGPQPTGTIREKIDGQRKSSGPVAYPRTEEGASLLKNILRELADVGTGGRRPVYPFSDVQRAAKEMRMAEFRPDVGHAPNFILGSDGGEYYVDNIGKFNSIFKVRDEILGYMQKHEYSADERKVVATALTRLEAIDEEVKTERQKTWIS